MAGDDDFEPDDLQFQTSVDGERVRLIFIRDTGEHQAVVLRRSHLASLVAGAQKLLSPRDAVPIDRGSLRPGTTLELTSFQFSPQGSELGLTLFVGLPDQDRGVTIPLCLSRKDAAAIMEQLRRWLESLRPS